MGEVRTRLTEEQAKRLWDEYVRTHDLPPGIPARPDEVYADEGWIGWRDWIGADEEQEEEGVRAPSSTPSVGRR